MMEKARPDVSVELLIEPAVPSGWFWKQKVEPALMVAPPLKVEAAAEATIPGGEKVGGQARD
jgi:hypothetical protein